jgi:hypothetical protein
MVVGKQVRVVLLVRHKVLSVFSLSSDSSSLLLSSGLPCVLVMFIKYIVHDGETV